jgi:5-methylcytosine-specific restriction enzyme A
MPPRPLRPCATAGCPALVETGHCDQHRLTRERVRSQARATRTARGYDNRWGRYSARRLEYYPFCVHCGRLADVTDHILPIRTHPHLRMDPANHQSLCLACNARKAIREEGAFHHHG